MLRARPEATTQLPTRNPERQRRVETNTAEHYRRVPSLARSAVADPAMPRHIAGLDRQIPEDAYTQSVALAAAAV
jgi:hypothetical protein